MIAIPDLLYLSCLQSISLVLKIMSAAHMCSKTRQLHSHLGIAACHELGHGLSPTSSRQKILLQPGLTQQIDRQHAPNGGEWGE